MAEARKMRMGGAGRLKKVQDKSENVHAKSRLRSTTLGSDDGRKPAMRRSCTSNNNADPDLDLDQNRNPLIVRRTKSESQRQRPAAAPASCTDSNCNLSVEELTSTSTSRSDDSPNCSVELAQTEKVHLEDLDPDPDPDPINSDETQPLQTTTDPAGPHLRSTPPPFSYQLEEAQSKLQNIVDLVMWKDVSRSAFVFGFGSFLLLSSSFARDINFSIITALSYMALIYLAATFFYKSLNSRKNSDLEESNPKYSLGIGEEDAIWLIHFILPYLNGVVFQLQALFSGDPKITLKLGIILFLLARCGNSITIWSMAKLGFLGVFSIPKVYSLYSTKLIKYGKFWMRRFEDAWNTCSNKKAVLIVIFTLIWNLSSVTARIWAVFMLVVAVRCYQQYVYLPREDWKEQQLDACGGGAQTIII